ncbi:MAG: 2OG-Fe(II) oxygenase [Gallionella sp.]|nr:2OG-Fe(II) oxygenase [Gallionella sp.]
MTEPYPHLVTTDALDPAIFEQLSSQFPADDIILNGRAAKDTWFDYPACKVVADERVSPLWREFFAYHSSKAFFDELVALAAPQMCALKPDLEQRAGRHLKDFIVGMRPGGRGDPLAEGADASMECQFYLNYTQQPRVVRGPHVDRPSELFAALLYFRREDDDSSGANLEICEATTDLYPNPHVVKISTLPAEIDDAKVRTVKTANYAANTLVLFLNSARSIHAVSPRTPTAVPRRHINFCCDVRFDLFDMKLPARMAAKKKLEAMPLGWRLAKYL